MIIKKEHANKVKHGYRFTPGDLEVTPKGLIQMVSLSFFGAFMAAFTGCGPGGFFVSALIMIDIEQQVASATGMYLSMFTTLSASIQMIILNKLHLEYGFWIQIMTAVGTLLGIFF